MWCCSPSSITSSIVKTVFVNKRVKMDPKKACLWCKTLPLWAWNTFFPPSSVLRLYFLLIHDNNNICVFVLIVSRKKTTLVLRRCPTRCTGSLWRKDSTSPSWWRVSVANSSPLLHLEVAWMMMMMAADLTSESFVIFWNNQSSIFLYFYPATVDDSHWN